MPALPIHDLLGVSEIGAATGGSPYKRMKQPCGLRGTKEKTSVPPGGRGVGGKNQGVSNPNRQTADGYYI